MLFRSPSQASASGFNGQAGWQPDSGWRLTQISVSDKYLSKQPLVQYGYSSAGDLVEVKDRYGRVTRRFAYKNHLLFAHQEFQGPEHTYCYEADLPGAKVLNQYNEQGLDYQFIYQDHGEHNTSHRAIVLAYRPYNKMRVFRLPISAFISPLRACKNQGDIL